MGSPSKSARRYSRRPFATAEMATRYIRRCEASRIELLVNSQIRYEMTLFRAADRPYHKQCKDQLDTLSSVLALVTPQCTARSLLYSGMRFLTSVILHFTWFSCLCLYVDICTWNALIKSILQCVPDIF